LCYFLFIKLISNLSVYFYNILWMLLYK
jgi:hypothetical protein